VVHYLPCFGEWHITCPLYQPSLLFLCLFSESLALRVCFFTPSPFSGAGSVCHLPPLLSILDYSSMFVF
jgi:hypothetical protein